MAGNPIQRSEIITPDAEKALHDLLIQFQKLQAEVKELKALMPQSVGKLADVQKLNQVQERRVKTTEKLTKAQREQANVIKEATKLQKQEEQLLAKREVLNTNAAKSTERLRQATQKRNQELKKEVRLEDAAADSLVVLEARLTKLRQEYARTSATSRSKLIPQIQKLDTEVKKARASLGQFQGNVGNYQSGLAGLRESFFKATVAITGAVAAVRRLSRFMSESIQLADKQATAERKLLVAVGWREDATRRLVKQSAELQRVTTFGDEESIEAAAQMAAMMNGNADAVSELLPLVQDMAAFMGMDLSMAASLVGKSLGSATNALSRYGIEITGTVGSAERLASAVEALTDKFGGQAQALAEVGVGQLEQFKNAWGDTKELIGATLLDLTGGVDEATESLNRMNVVLETKTLKAWQKFAVLSANVLAPAFGVDLTEGAAEYVKTLEDAEVAVENLGGGEEKQLNTKKKVTKTTKEATTAYENLSSTISKLNKKLKEAIITGGDVDVIMSKMIPLQEELDRVDQFFNFLTKFDDINKQLARSLAASNEELEVFFDEIDEGFEDLEKDADAFIDSVSQSTADFLTRKWYEDIGFSEKDIDIIKKTISQMSSEIFGFFEGLASARADMAQTNFDIANEELQNLQQELANRIALAETGAAVEIGALEDQIATQKELQDQATEDLRKAKEAQIRLQKAQQIQALVTAGANALEAATAAGGVAGWAIGLAALASLLVGFTAFKSEATKLEEGGYGDETGVISGKRHSQGGESFTDNIEVEQGEAWGVLNRSATKKYGNTFFDITQDMNRGVFDPELFDLNFKYQFQRETPVIVNDNRRLEARLTDLLTEQKTMREYIGRLENQRHLEGGRYSYNRIDGKGRVTNG